MDNQFISGEFLKEDSLPKEKRYLYNYFRTDVQKAFIRYMHVFDNSRFFLEHSGYACATRFVQMLARRLRNIEQAHAEAKSAMDIERLGLIEKGMVRFKRGSKDAKR